MRLADPVDQATGLRRLFASGPAFRAAGVLGPDARRNARVCAALAQGLSRRGNRVLVLDEARPPYNVGGMLGVLSRHSLADAPRMQLEDVAVGTTAGVHLLAAQQGLQELAGLSEQALLELADGWAGDAPEWMLLNGRGEGAHGGGLAATADLRVLVLPGGKDWLAQAYAVLKTAHAAWSGGEWLVLVEGLDLEAAQRLYASLRETASRFLGFAPAYLGCLPKHRDGQGGGDDPHAGLLAEALQSARIENPANFEQYWQRMWLFSRMNLDAAGRKSRNAERHPG
ncbi:MAG: hypothetical protein AB1831_13410 [Pseudomonadota bacterium]